MTPAKTKRRSLPTAVDAVVFDCDGVLLDTKTLLDRAETALFSEHGHPFGREQKKIVIGGTLEAAGTAMAEYFGRPGDGPNLAQRPHHLVAIDWPPAPNALPGARDLVQALRGRVPIAVASNSPRSLVETALASAGLADLFTHMFAAEDVVHPKPAPDLYLWACASLGADPVRSIALEESFTGVASTRAAGMHVVGVPSLPGVVLDADTAFTALTDPVLTGWSAHAGARAQ